MWEHWPMTNSQLIDLRSDTVTKPSDGMREAMAKALVGDDVYGEDPTINSLEERVAKLFGKEAALFCPSGSLANQLSIRMLVAPGEELITETNSHIVRAELGAGAVFSGITTRTWLASRGLLSADDALNIARPDSGPYLVSTTAIAVENTHNFGGGTIQPISEIKKLREESEKLGIALHLDGARIWNAHIASGVELIEYGKYFDTISVCLSKGLGAPVGSLMVSTKKDTSSLSMVVHTLIGCLIFFLVLFAKESDVIPRPRMVEEVLLKKEGVDAEFMGHPFVETVKTSMSRDEAMSEFSLDSTRKIIGLMPGSRNSELKYLLDIMINSANEIKKNIKVYDYDHDYDYGYLYYYNYYYSYDY